MSYADTVTLLMCFFVLFFSQADKKKEDILEVIAESFGSEKNAGEETPRGVDTAMGAIRSEMEGLKKALGDFNMKMEVVMPDDSSNELKIRFSAVDFFWTGDHRLKPQGRMAMQQFSSRIKPFLNRIALNVEGHADSRRLKKKVLKKYKSNLALSAHRATAAASYLLRTGIAETSLRVRGYGASVPLVPEYDKDKNFLELAANKNRRIEIRISPSEE